MRRKDEFEEELTRILRRASKLKAAMEGSANIRRVSVRSCTVPEHKRGSHERIIISLRKEGS